MRRPEWLLVLLLATPVLAQTPQERERRKILEQLGLEKQEKKPPPPSERVPEPEPAPPAAPSPTATPPPVTPFVGRVHQGLLGACRSCHVAGGPAGSTRLVLSGSASADHASVRSLVDLGAPRRSVLLTKAIGQQHGGGATLTTASDVYRRVLGWIADGAVLSAGAGAAVPPRPRAPVALAPTRRTPPPEPPPAPAPTAAPVMQPPAPAEAVASMPAEASALHLQLERACRPCHVQGGTAGTTRLVLTGVVAADLQSTRAYQEVSPGLLASKAAGEQHGGGAIWPAGSAGASALQAWIAAGAPTGPPAAADAPPVVAPAVPPPPPTVAPPPAVGGRPPHAHRQLEAVLLGQTLTLNGRFDLNVERRAFRSNPFAERGQTALQSYHHFLFLTRSSADDPVTLTAEIVNLELYEIATRLSPRRAPWAAHVRAGKILVPFGAEPLYHQHYGGHAGFDQRVLPTIWTSFGAAASAAAAWRGLSFTGDLYALNGYRLRREDATLNLRNDIAPLDDAQLAFGARVGLGRGPLWAFYSGLSSGLGFDRRLYMQALDVGLWRWRRVPVLDRLVLAAGLLRADVSGGGSGKDHYHFASYWLARVYAFDWLSLQYRQGLRTLGNKRGIIGDDTRWDAEDGSTHNVTLAARWHGVQAGVSYYLNFEKAREVDDDLLRFTVALEF